MDRNELIWMVYDLVHQGASCVKCIPGLAAKSRTIAKQIIPNQKHTKFPNAYLLVNMKNY